MRSTGPAPVRRVRWLLAAVAYLPLLWNAPGRVSADTKTYLTLDPARLIARAPVLWDPATGLGTVSHQTIGYLFPLGPWYWLADRLQLPDWLAQRLWLGTVFFAAGAGVLAFARHLRLPWRAAAVAAVAYQLSPYLLPYAARLSVILLPWAGLGWLMTFVARALDEGRWRWPAAFALVVLTIGGVNATALVLVGLGPLCYLVWAVVGDRTTTARRAGAMAARIGLLCVGVSAWWMVGLWAQGRYGLPILRYTETYEAVARASTPAEALRGLGYWFGYGRDAVSPWVEAVPPYTHHPLLYVVSMAVPAAALTALARSRWRHRSLPVVLLIVGLVVSVGAHPYGSPSPVGRVLRAVIGSDVGQALRSTPRAGPLVALGLALGLGVGVEALAFRRPTLRWAAPVAAMVLLAVNLPGLWSGRLLTESILRDEDVPDAWREAAALLDERDAGSRVLEVPGSDFASYRWGGTVDPVLVGLTDRDVVARELVPWGSPASADLLAALDRRWQDRIVEPAAVVPLLRRLGVGEVVLRGDLQYERYRLARPRPLDESLQATPGLGGPLRFGDPFANTPVAGKPLLDAEELTVATATPDPPAVSIYTVADPRPVVRLEPARATIVAGDGEGLVDAAAVGLLDGAGVLRYAAELAARPGALEAALAGGSDVVVTDTNRRQARRWGSVREYLGATETAGEVPLRADPTDNRLDLFPGADASSATTAVVEGVRRVQATAYGNPITYTPEDRAVMAVDGDPRTAWRVAAFAEARGERLEVELDAPVTTDHVTVLQPLDGPRNRWITEVALRFDGADPLVVALDDTSRTAPGQRLDIGPRTFRTLSIEITATNFTRLPGYAGISAVGFAEVDVAGSRAVEVVRLPGDVLDRVGTQALSLVLTRWRASALEVNRRDPEPALVRSFRLPVARSFTLAGTGAVSPRADDATVVSVLAPSGATAVATARLAGDPTGTGLATVDGDPGTVWRTPIDAPNQSVRVEADASVTVDTLRLQLVADGRHSVPTRLLVTADDGVPVAVSVPAVVDSPTRDGRATVTVPFGRPLTGRSFTLTIDEVRAVRSIDADSGAPVVQPVGIAEWGLPGVSARPVDDGRPGVCRDDLVRVDDRAVAVRVTRRGTELAVVACAPLALAAGEHRLETAPGWRTGLDVDRLVLTSPAGPAAAARPSAPAAPARADAGVTRTGRTSYRVAVTDADEPFWLVLGQSHNAGWRARVAGTGDLGPPTLVDGYANGWLVQPRGPTFTVELTWAPQRVVWRGLAVSVVAVAACLALVVRGRRLPAARRPAQALSWRRSEGHVPDGADGADAADGADRDGGARSTHGARRGAAWGAVTAVALALMCSGLVAGAVVAAVVVAARRLPMRYARLVVLAPAGLLGAVALFTLAKQTRYDLPTDLDWPRAFDTVQPLAWAAVFAAVPAYRPARRRVPAPRVPPARPASAVEPGPGPVAPPSVEADPAAASAAGPATPTWPPGLRRDPGPP